METKISIKSADFKVITTRNTSGKSEDGQYIHFKHVRDEAGNYKNFKCSNIGFRYEER